MKRSDIILNIASEIVMFNHNINFGTAQDMAEVILIRIEKDGMLPPSYTYIPGNPDIISSIGSGRKNEWEPEINWGDSNLRAEVPGTNKTMDELRREEFQEEMDLLSNGQCPCGDVSSEGCNVTGCLLACYNEKFNEKN